MKKLMIAAAIVCAAAFVHAGQINWSSDYLNAFGVEGDGDYVDGGTVYLINSSASTFLTAFAESGWDSAIGGATVLASATLSEAALSDPSSASYPVTVSPQDAIIIGDGTTGAPAGSQTIFMAYYDAANSAAYISERLTGEVPAGSGAQAFAFGNEGAYAGNVFAAADGLQTAGGYYTAVPEPTSGLLLLLGVAGLALRRRRA